jgi:hypothetical protein
MRHLGNLGGRSESRGREQSSRDVGEKKKEKLKEERDKNYLGTIFSKEKKI